MSRPNVLLIMADQLSALATSPYGNGDVLTPHMQGLAERGTTFQHAYCNYPICVPSRMAMVTGRLPASIESWDNGCELPASTPTLMHHLRLAGYRTLLSGKMHFIGPDQLHGFRRRLTTDVFPAGLDWVPILDEDGKFVRGGHARSYVAPNVGPVAWTKFLAYDEETQFRALEFVRERGRTAADEPFFLVVSYLHPHNPFHVTQDLWDLYEGAAIEVPSWPEDVEHTYSAMDRWVNEAHETDQVELGEADSLYRLRRSYFGLVTYVDCKLGELLVALEQTGQD